MSSRLTVGCDLEGLAMSLRRIRRNSTGRAERSGGRGGAVLWVLLMIAAGTVAAQTSAPHTGTAMPSGDEPAELVIANRPVVTLRASVLGASPVQRVEAITERIDALLDKGGQPVATMRPVEGGFIVYAGNEPAFRILDADVDPDSNLTTRQLAEQVTARFGQALAEVAEARNARALLPAAGWSLLATALLVLALWFLARVSRWTIARVRAVIERRAQKYDTGWRGHLLGVAHPATLVVAPLRLATWLVALLLIYTWTGFVLQRFPYTRPWGEALRDNLLAALGGFGASLLKAIPGLLFVVLIFVLARLAVRVVRAFFEAVHQGRVALRWVDQTTARPTGRIFSWLIWLLALVAAYPYIPGSESEAFKGVGVFVGLMLSIGSSGIVNQAVSGLMLMYTRALRPGEFVQVADTEGTVKSVGFLTTRIETLRREEVSIPNALIAQSVTRNYSRLATEGGVRIATKVTIGYDVPWRQVHAMLQLAAERTAGLVRDAEARVLQTALHDSYVEYTLLVTVADPLRRPPVLSELHANIQDVFNENGVQIMTPNYEGDPEQPKIVASADWFRAPARREPGAARDGGGTP
jgi:small-conductance mechanosensitive channel